ncbi:hypothetical protein D3C81_1874520 [compost metagenome]
MPARLKTWRAGATVVPPSRHDSTVREVALISGVTASAMSIDETMAVGACSNSKASACGSSSSGLMASA